MGGGESDIWYYRSNSEQSPRGGVGSRGMLPQKIMELFRLSESASEAFSEGHFQADLDHLLVIAI